MRPDPRIRRLGTLSFLAAVVWSAPAAGQSLQNAPGQIPQGSPFNNSFTENIDFADVDLDGDWDAVNADGGDCCNDQNRLWMNQGGAQGGTIGFFADETATRFPNVTDDSRDMDFVDVDADGDQDLYISNTAQISNQTNRFWVNMGGQQGGTVGFFTDQTAAHWKNIGGPGSSVANSLVLASGGFIDWSCDCVFGDLDNDGDIDLMHSTYGGAFAGNVPSRIFLNDGAGAYEEFNPSGFQLPGATIANGSPGLWCEGTYQGGTTNATGAQCDIAETPLGVEIGDLDGDFDIDILHGSRNTHPRIYTNRLQENGGSLGFRDVTQTALAQKASGGGNYEQELGDLDNDGDLDIYGLNWSGFTDIVSRNDGSGNFGAFTSLAGSGSDDNEGDWFDYNNDGNLDIFVTNFSGQDRLYENSGPPSFAFSNVTGSQMPSYSNTGLGSDAADIDLDGDYDFLIGNDSGQANRLLKNVNQVADTRAPYLPHIEQAPDRVPSSVPTTVRVQVYDNASWNITQFNSASLEYRVDAGAVTSVPMVYAGGNIFRGEIPGNLSGQVSYQAKSADKYGNTGASAVRSYSSGGCSGALQTYCTAKQTSIPGCLPAVGFSGSPSISAGSGFLVTAGPAPGNNPGLYIYSTNPSGTPISNAYGFLCVAPSGLFRVGAQNGGGNNGVCNGQYSFDFNQYAATQTQNPNLVAGAQVEIQVWYRDPPNPGTANLTDAGRFVLCP